MLEVALPKIFYDNDLKVVYCKFATDTQHSMFALFIQYITCKWNMHAFPCLSE